MDKDFKELQKQLATNVKLARVAAGLTQETLALAAGIERSHISQIERGIANPALRTLLRVALALDTNVSALLSGQTGLMEILTQSKRPK